MNDFSLRYKVDTSFDSGLIKQEVLEIRDGVQRKMWENIVKLQDEGIRKALIDLGWTPPPERTGAEP